MAGKARELPVGGVSGVIATDEGWYVVQHVSDLDADATSDRLEELKESAKQEYLQNLEDSWAKETPFFTVIRLRCTEIASYAISR